MIRTIALTIAIVLFSVSSASANIRITEIAWMGTVDSQFGEWFELQNTGTSEVNLDGWKLYEDGGGQSIITLTKIIPAGGYLVVERTTASTPDPLPGVNDESGPFGGSGFANTGEDLVLKDALGATIQSLSFISGWPAGETESKKTMQWDGAAWVTATATPKAGLVPGDGGEEVPDVPPPAPGGSAWSAPRTEPRIEFFVPKTIYTNVRSDYSAKTFLEYQTAHTGVFLWNMGDGTIIKTSTAENITHTYLYPGTYTISFAYYRASYEKKPLLMSSIERTVISPGVSFAVLQSKGFEFTNTDTVPLDLSGWFIVLPEKTIELPPFTILSPKKTIIMPFSAFGLSTVTNAVLQTPEYFSINNTSSTMVESRTTLTPIAPKIVAPAFIYEPTILQASTEEVVEVVSKEPVTKNHIKIIVFSVVLLVVIILFVRLERIMGAEKEGE